MSRGHNLEWLAAELAKALRGEVGELVELNVGMGAGKHIQHAIIITTGVGIPLRIWETDDSASFRSRTSREFDISIVWPTLPGFKGRLGRDEVTMDDVMTEEERAPWAKQPQYRPGLPITCGVTEPVPAIVEQIRRELFDRAGRYYMRAVAQVAAGPKPPTLRVVK